MEPDINKAVVKAVTRLGRLSFQVCNVCLQRSTNKQAASHLAACFFSLFSRYLSNLVECTLYLFKIDLAPLKTYVLAKMSFTTFDPHLSAQLQNQILKQA